MCHCGEEPFGVKSYFFSKISKFSYVDFDIQTLYTVKLRFTINFSSSLVLKGANNVNSKVEFDILRLNQREKFICLQSLRHKGCVQRPISCLSIINLDSMIPYAEFGEKFS